MAGQSGKGNPAAKRMGNAAHKTRRSLSWQRGEKRKEARRQAQAERELANRHKRSNGEPTAWEEARAVRAADRDKDPVVLERRKRLGVSA